ncbi:hypothetical protein ACIRYZ_29250 [Kitasatospora sp. NPDC101155]|uniref:hypothetical protein n=1 Tax=Kitasatospora sp. NPDC101155 TaxID=3364097 RepID=UPI0038302807
MAARENGWSPLQRIGGAVSVPALVFGVGTALLLHDSRLLRRPARVVPGAT